MTLASLRLTIASRQNLTLINHDRRYRCFIDPSDKDYLRLTLHNSDHLGFLSTLYKRTHTERCCCTAPKQISYSKNGTCDTTMDNLRAVLRRLHVL